MHSTGFCVEWPVSDCRGLSDLPQRRLFPVAGPMPGAAVAHGVKAWLMLSVVVAAADDQLAFGPNDLRAHGKAANLKAGLNHPPKLFEFCHPRKEIRMVDPV